MDGRPRNRALRRWLLPAAVLAAVLPAPALAVDSNIFTVTPGSPDVVTNDTELACREDPFTPAPPGTPCTLRTALALISSTFASGDRLSITLPAGDYVLKGQLAAPPMLGGKPLVLRGAGAGATRILRDVGAPPFGVVAVPAGRSLVLEGLTVARGFLSSATGAGIRVDAGGTLATDGVVVRDNSTPDSGGGGVWNEGSATLVRTQLLSNVAYASGGYGGKGTLVMRGSLVSGNSAGVSAGVETNGPATIENSTIAGNLGGGEGVYSGEGGITIRSTTIAGNSGAGLLLETGADLEGVVVWGNAGGDCARGAIPQQLIVVGSVFGAPGACAGPGVTVADPRLGPLADHGGPTPTLVPGAGSPALDLMPATQCPTTGDQRGGTRPQGAGCDAGAVEVGALADLSARADPAALTGTAGRAVAAVVRVANRGPDPVAAVLSVSPPAGVQVAGTGCAGGPTVRCAAGTIAPGATVAVTLQVTAAQAGRVSLTATASPASATALDTAPGDEAAALTLTIGAATGIAAGDGTAPVARLLAPSCGRRTAARCRAARTRAAFWAAVHGTVRDAGGSGVARVEYRVRRAGAVCRARRAACRATPWRPARTSAGRFTIALPGLTPGARLLEARAVDRAGNVQRSPARLAFTIR